MPVTTAAWRTGNVGYLLFAATGIFIRQKLKAVSTADIGVASDAQMALFQNLDFNGNRLTSIAERADMTKSAMIELVDRAQAAALVVRQPDPDDRRAKIVCFTPQGLRVHERLRQGIVEEERRLAELIGLDRLTKLKTGLRQYAAFPDLIVVASGKFPKTDGGAEWRTENAGRVLSSAARRFMYEVLGCLHERGNREVTEVLLTLFRNLDFAGTRLTELAHRARMTKQSMRELVDRAEALDLVVRLPDSSDGRAKVISFTKSGFAMMEEIRTGISRAEAEMAKVVGKEFVLDLKTALKRYVSHDPHHKELRAQIGTPTIYKQRQFLDTKDLS